MKIFSRIILLCLVVSMTLGLLTGCETTQEKIAALSGTWTMVVNDTEEEALELLKSIEMYEEEIALIDLTSLKYVQLVEFTTEKTYRFSFDAEATRACIREFFANAFDALYAGRSTLNEVYQTSFDEMTEEEFKEYYRLIYDVDSFETMLDVFADSAYDYEALAEDWETGTYNIRFNEIHCTITGETQAESLKYSINGGTLVLTYIDGVETYTRSK